MMQTDLGQIPGLRLWLESRYQQLVSGDTLTTWTDKSPAGNDVTQVTAGLRATWYASITNSLFFDGLDNYAFAANALGNNMHGAGAVTFCLVLRLVNTTGTSASANYFFETRHTTGTAALMEMRADSGNERRMSVSGRSITSPTDGFQEAHSTARVPFTQEALLCWGVFDFSGDKIHIKVGDAPFETNSVTFSASTFTYASESAVAKLMQGAAATIARSNVWLSAMFMWTNILNSEQISTVEKYCRARMDALPSSTWLLQSGGRIDALLDAGNDVVLAGSRTPNPGNIWRSTNAGQSWTALGTVVGSTNPIQHFSTSGGGVCYLVCSNTTVWKSLDYGSNWFKLVQVTNITAEAGAAQSYAIQPTGVSGTVLLSTSQAAGGQIFRSTDHGTNWLLAATLGTRGIYRILPVSGGYLAFGWEGHVFKTSTASDGVAWADISTVSAVQLWAPEYLGNSIVLLSDHNGVLWRSTDDGTNWTNIGDLGADTDDMAYLGNGRVLHSITADHNLKISNDYGQTWAYVDRTGSQLSGDWPEHLIKVTDANGQVWALWSSNLGFVTRRRGAEGRPW